MRDSEKSGGKREETDFAREEEETGVRVIVRDKGCWGDSGGYGGQRSREVRGHIQRNCPRTCPVERENPQPIDLPLIHNYYVASRLTNFVGQQI